MSLNTKATIDAIHSHFAASGLFARVHTHEPKNAPDTDMSAALWVGSIGPAPADSGLAASTAVVVYMGRLYIGMINEPQDSIDPNLVVAIDTLMTALVADFTLSGAVRNIDLLGQTGDTLSAVSGYVTIGTTMYRVMDITIPVIVNDAWTQTP